MTTDTPETVQLFTLHTVKLPAVLGGLEVHNHVKVFLDDRNLFNELCRRYDVEPQRYDATDQRGAFDSIHFEIDDQPIVVFFSMTAGWCPPHVHVDVRIDAAEQQS